MIHDLEIEAMRERFDQRMLMREPRCGLSIISAIGTGLGVAAGAGAFAAGLSVVAGIAASGVSIAAAAGAFTPSNPGGNGTQSTINPQKQILNLQHNLESLAAQEKADQAALAAAQATQKKWQYAAAGLAVLAVVAIAISSLEQRKK